MNQQPLFLGIDGGATKCRVVLQDFDGKVLGTGLGGSANPSHGMHTVIDSIQNAVQMAIAKAGLSMDVLTHTIAGAGLAGLHLARYRQQANEWQHPFRRLYLTDDLQIACLGAHGGQDGAVIIAGTGFSATSVTLGDSRVLGGYGFLMGDKCSGSWIGHQALQQVLLATDGLAPPTALEALIADKFDAQGAELADQLIDATPSQYASLAPLVFLAASKGDKPAEDILQQSADFLSRVARRLLESQPPRLSLVGSIAEMLRARLEPEVQSRLTALQYQPEVGAIHFARQMYAKEGQEVNA